METSQLEKELKVPAEVTSNGHTPQVVGLETPIVRPGVEFPEGRIKGAWALGVLRISLGFVFLWSFLDKAFALGFSTGRNPETGAIDFFGADAWINGGSPTDGAILFGAKGPFADLYANLAGLAWVEWVYMLSMLLIGTALILGVATRLAAIGGIIWLAVFYTLSAIWPEHNPFVDDHVIYALVLVVLAAVGAGRYFGFGRWWERTTIVQRFPVLK